MNRFNIVPQLMRCSGLSLKGSVDASLYHYTYPLRLSLLRYLLSAVASVTMGYIGCLTVLSCVDTFDVGLSNVSLLQ